MNLETSLDRVEKRWRYLTSLVLIVLAFMAVRGFVRYGVALNQELSVPASVAVDQPLELP